MTGEARQVVYTLTLCGQGPPQLGKRFVHLLDLGSHGRRGWSGNLDHGGSPHLGQLGEEILGTGDGQARPLGAEK
jgi:hypothetical protein